MGRVGGWMEDEGSGLSGPEVQDGVGGPRPPVSVLLGSESHQLNPVTDPAQKFSGLKSAHIHSIFGGPITSLL